MTTVARSFPLLLIFAWSIAKGQSFERTIGSTDEDIAMAVAQTASGEYITCGITHGFGKNNSQVYLIKTDNYGDSLWTRTYDFGIGSAGNDLQMTNGGGFIIAGRTIVENSHDVLLLKVGVDGGFEWAKAYGGSGDDWAEAVRQTSDGGYIVAGYTTSYGAGSMDIYLLKISANGDLEWTRTYGSTGNDWAFDVWQNEDDGFTLAGGMHGALPDADALLMRTNANGDVIWSSSIGGIEDDYFYSVQQTDDGGFVAAGSTFFGGSTDILLVKVDENGAETWTEQIGGVGAKGCYAVKQSNDEGYVLAGFHVPSFFLADGYLVRTDAAGDVLWTSSFGGVDDDQLTGLVFTVEGGYMLFGYTFSFGFGGAEFYYVKTDADGNDNCEEFNSDIAFPDPNIDYEPWEPEENSGGDVIELSAIIGAGGFTQTNCSSLDVQDVVAMDDDISVYPNPACDMLYVQSTQLADNFSWRILNLYGQVVATGIFPSGHGTIDISSISDGQYVLEYQHSHVIFTVIY